MENGPREVRPASRNTSSSDGRASACFSGVMGEAPPKRLLLCDRGLKKQPPPDGGGCSSAILASRRALRLALGGVEEADDLPRQAVDAGVEPLGAGAVAAALGDDDLLDDPVQFGVGLLDRPQF